MSTAGGARLRGNRLEILPHFLERHLRVDVADDAEDGVVGRVVGLEERGDVVHGRGAEVGHRADDRVLVGEVLERELVADFEGAAVGLVVDAEPPFFLHGVALVVEVRPW